MKKLLFIVLLFVSPHIFSQGIKISNVKEIASGSTAFNAPTDQNGNSAGLIKVSSTLQDLSFDGDVVGKIDYQMNEYNVFLAKGSKQLIVRRPHVLPIVIDLPDYGIEEVVSKATYTLTIKNDVINTSKNGLLIDVKPRGALVYIDEIHIANEDGSGGYRLYLKKGEHICRVESPGYRSEVYVVNIGKETQSISATLESLMAEVQIHSQTGAVDIFVDGKLVATDDWRGELPAGKHRVEAVKEGFLSRSMEVVLEEKESRQVIIPKLDRVKGNLIVQTIPEEAEVFVDGEKVDKTSIIDILSGIHLLKVSMPFGYKEIEKDISMHGGSNNIKIELEPQNETYGKAFDGNVNAQVLLCKEKMESSLHGMAKDTVERNYWFERLYENLDKLDKEQFDIICPYVTDGISPVFERAGIYTYYIDNMEKGLDILIKWHNYNPHDEYIIWEIINKFRKKEDVKEVLNWCARGIEVASFEIGYMESILNLIAEICVDLDDLRKAEDLVKRNFNNIEKEYYNIGWEIIYYSIGDIYRLRGNSQMAVFYLKHFLDQAPKDGYLVDKAKTYLELYSSNNSQ